jgi:HD-like signal output (HDOD) protein
LVHDLGRLLILKLYPIGFAAMVAHAKAEAIPLHQAERRYLGVDSRELGYHFACKQGLPAIYCNVIRWAQQPEKATEDLDLVAAVSLARDVVLHNHVGYCGDTPKDSCPPIEETAAWQVLQHRVFPSFNLRRFEAQAQFVCAQLKGELLGRHS